MIIVRQQPAPCITFISSTSHGFIAGPSYAPTGRYNRQLCREVAKANDERRPRNGFRSLQASVPPALCPARFIDIRGQWETFSGQGRAGIGTGRAGWLSGAMIPAPIDWPGVTPMPAIDPIAYWTSAGWLNIQPVDSMIFARFLAAAVGVTGEIMGRHETSSAGMDAASRLNQRYREAIVDADEAMSTCDGVIFADLIGHSRGAAMLTQSLRLGLGNRSTYNFDVSTTLLDGLDSLPPVDFSSGGSVWSHLSNARPWIEPGEIVGDPRITRVGSEWNSSFYCDDSSGEIPNVEFEEVMILDSLWLEDALAAIPGVNYGAEFLRSEIVGLPKGRDRQAQLERVERSFGAYQGPIQNIRHKEFAGDGTEVAPQIGIGFNWVRPADALLPEGVTDLANGVPGDNLFAPSPVLGNASAFSTASSTHIGQFLVDPRGFDTSTARGFHPTIGLTPAELDACEPPLCGGASSCEEAGDQGTRTRDADGLEVRELVPDFDFRLMAGMVENATAIVDIYPNLKVLFPDDGAAPFRQTIQETADARWFDGSNWRRTGDVIVKAGLTAIDDRVGPYTRAPGIDYQGIDTTAEALAELQRLEDEIDNLPAGEGADRLATLAAAAGGLTSGDDAWLQFPADTSWASVFLSPASVAAETLLVRVEYEIGVGGAMSVKLSGPGNLKTSASFTDLDGIGRRVAELLVTRPSPATHGRDELSIKGTDIKVFAASVRPSVPFNTLGSDSAWEFVLLEAGVTMERAAALASRSMWQGVPGRLAIVHDTTILDAWNTQLGPDAPGWVDARSETGGSGSFKDSQGTTVVDGLFDTSTSFTVARPRGAWAYAGTAKNGCRLGHTHPTMSIQANRAGFWVEYPGQSAMMATTQAPGLLERVGAFLGLEAEASESADQSAPFPTVQVAEGIPSCVADDDSSF